MTMSRGVRRRSNDIAERAGKAAVVAAVLLLSGDCSPAWRRTPARWMTPYRPPADTYTGQGGVDTYRPAPPPPDVPASRGSPDDAYGPYDGAPRRNADPGGYGEPYPNAPAEQCQPRGTLRAPARPRRLMKVKADRNAAPIVKTRSSGRRRQLFRQGQRRPGVGGGIGLSKKSAGRTATSWDRMPAARSSLVWSTARASSIRRTLAPTKFTGRAHRSATISAPTVRK